MSAANGNSEDMEQELNVLSWGICDGLRQEERSRWLARADVTGKRIPDDLGLFLSHAREAEVSSSLYRHLRSVGFSAQLESYFAWSNEASRRPDFRIWLPFSKTFLYLEFKTFAWGSGYYFYGRPVLDDLKKLSGDTNPGNLPNGILAIGFSRANESSGSTLQTHFQGLASDISEKYSPYQQVSDLAYIDLGDIDNNTSYAMVGMWVRRPASTNSE